MLSIIGLAAWAIIGLPIMYSSWFVAWFASWFETSQAANDCVRQFLGVCFVATKSDANIFGFAVFVQAFALLVVIYTVSDVRYRFRVVTAPIPIWQITFWSSAAIGIGALVTDFWFAENYLLPRVVSSQPVWQALFGAMFLILVLIWIWYAFIFPPVFGTRNAKKYLHELYRYILRGSASELPAISAELGRSAEAIVTHAREMPFVGDDTASRPPKRPSAAEYAHDLMLLIGNRKLCRSVVAESPGTAIAIFDAMSRQRKYRLPLGQFASNVSTEALLNKDSALFHEDAGYYSGLIGYIKPFSTALYGDFDVVEGLAEQNSPLDLRLDLRFSWDATQVEAYSRAILLTFNSYVSGRHWGHHSFALTRAFSDIQSASSGLYRLNGTDSLQYLTDEYARLRAVVDFIKDAVEILNKQRSQFRTTLRHRGERQVFTEDMYDRIANFMFEVIFDASTVRSPIETCWSIQHNAVWSELFSFHDGAAWKIVRFKLRRLLYDEVVRLGDMPNYKSARILGLCLNVFGLQVGNRTDYRRNEYALRRAVLNWTKKNYLSIKDQLPDVASACLAGSITFDEESHRLVKTYMKGLSREAPKEYLDLE